MPEGRRIAILTNELLGLVRTGGAGTATTFLAFALVRLGHDVELLFTDTSTAAAVDPEWSRRYAEHGIRVERLPSAAAAVCPPSLGVPFTVQQVLEEKQPEIIVANDWGGPAYGVLKLRELGLGFTNTLVVVYCHGTNSWTYEAHRQPRRSVGSFELEALERASVELADVVVSPSAYMLEWMRERGWAIPRGVIAPYFTRAAAAPPEPPPVAAAGRIRRIVFFGRLEERKGIAPFVEALNALDPTLLGGVEILFLGRETRSWPVERVRAALKHPARFERNLDQRQALAELRAPGTLAVMPSLVDNSPNVVYECLENGFPFLAGNRGGGPELVAPEDRSRVFVEPTAPAIRNALAALLAGPVRLQPARANFDRDSIRTTWRHVIATTRTAAEHHGADPQSDFVLLADDGDELDHDCRATLEHAQAASGADVVTCGVRTRRGRREEVNLFLGDPGALGVVANYYGSVGLYRRALLDGEAAENLDDDLDWPRLARLSLGGARIVSVPRPLARTGRPSGPAGGRSAALEVVRAFARVCPGPLSSLPRLVAGLAAQNAQPSRPATARERLAWVWEYEGARGLARRAGALLRRRGLDAGRLSGAGQAEP
jgi:glycosyltransferase involved in cell wall biosynthesis